MAYDPFSGDLFPPVANQGDGFGYLTIASRCEGCGKFTRASELRVIWGPMSESGPDHEAYLKCRPPREG